ncbi:MAG: pirin family protein [Parvularculaceae bacterium]
MIAIRKSEDRGRANHGWLDARHTFSFADYLDPAHMGFRALRVINEDRIAPGAGFPTHPHRDMEIVTYVLDGAVAHKDSTGGGGVIRPGEVQYMAAGTGVRHSEFNASGDEPLHLLQIWLLPDAPGRTPRYAQGDFTQSRRGRLKLVAARADAIEEAGEADALAINQDARLYASVSGPGDVLEHRFAAGRHGWIQVARGELAVGDRILKAGDGAAVSDEAALTFAAQAPETEFLLFDLA